MILRDQSFRRVNIMQKVFVSYIRPIIEFAAVLCFPHPVMQRQRVERVQSLFTRIDSVLSSLSYERRWSLLEMQKKLYSRVKISKLIILHIC